MFDSPEKGEDEKSSDRSGRLLLFKKSQFDHMNYALVIIIQPGQTTNSRDKQKEADRKKMGGLHES